jgi:hypothetical protein
MPLVRNRENESEELLKHVAEYLDEHDHKMNEYCKNILAFYKSIAILYDKHRAKLKTMEYEHELSVATFCDNNDEQMKKKESELQEKKTGIQISIRQMGTSFLVNILYFCRL